MHENKGEQIKLLKLTTGEEIIAYVSEGYTLRSPFTIMFTPQGSMLMPFMAMSKGHTVNLPAKYVVLDAVPNESLTEEYEKAVNPSRIETPKKQGLLMP